MNLFASFCNYKIKVIPKEKIYDVSLEYNDKNGNIFGNLIKQIADGCQQFKDSRPDFLTFMMTYTECVKYLNSVFELLNDETSKITYFDAIKFRLTYWLSRVEPSLLPSYTLDKPKYPIPRLKGNKKMIKTFLNRVYINSQYEIPNIVEINKGDIVIDAGAFYGDSAFYFDSAVSPDGLVYAFEPNKQIAQVLKDNIISNNRKNIVVVESGLSDKSSKATMSEDEASSFITDCDTIDNSNNFLVDLTTIDNFAEKTQLKKIDFIKMDIEGYELNAINGAMHSIKKYKPKLAISIYHRYSDMYELPLLINKIDPTYKFYVRHATESWNETILFCI
jgi:FkbM family methyltransferase